MSTDDLHAPAPTPAWATSLERREHAQKLKQTRPPADAERVLDVDHVFIERGGKTGGVHYVEVRILGIKGRSGETSPVGSPKPRQY